MNTPLVPLGYVSVATPDCRLLASGMELRDHFAAKAMQGLMAMEHATEYVDETTGEEMDYEEAGSSGTLYIHTKFLAVEAYMIADAMMEARKQK